MPEDDATRAAGVTRRRLLEAAAGGAVVLGVGGALNACGGSDEPQSTGSGTPARKPIESGGTLRVGIDSGGSSDVVDAHTAVALTDYARVGNLYDGLAARASDFSKIELQLAESIEPDATFEEWTVRVKDGVEFHNGKTIGADDVIFTLRRILDPKTLASGAGLLSVVDPKRLRKRDARTVEIGLSRPNAFFLELLAAEDSGIVPVGYDPQKPVGSGPFVFESFTPGKESVFRRFANYWVDGRPYVDALHIINISDDAARMNALIGGQVDAISNVPPARLAQVESNPSFEVLRSETGGWAGIALRIDRAPFDDKRVRQALRLLVDRPQWNAVALSDLGRVANDLWGPFDPAYAKDLPQREVDVEQARSLLRSAGQSDLRFELISTSLGRGNVESAQVFTEQAKQVGVTVDVRKVDTGDFYNTYFRNAPAAVTFWNTQSAYTQTSYSFRPDSAFNETHFADEAAIGLILQAEADADEARRIELLQEFQNIQYDRGGYITPAYLEQVDAYSSKLSGFVPDQSGFPLTGNGFQEVGYTS